MRLPSPRHELVWWQEPVGTGDVARSGGSEGKGAGLSAVSSASAGSLWAPRVARGAPRKLGEAPGEWLFWPPWCVPEPNSAGELLRVKRDYKRFHGNQSLPWVSVALQIAVKASYGGKVCSLWLLGSLETVRGGRGGKVS
jgi:hypothetical protein